MVCLLLYALIGYAINTFSHLLNLKLWVFLSNLGWLVQSTINTNIPPNDLILRTYLIFLLGQASGNLNSSSSVSVISSIISLVSSISSSMQGFSSTTVSSIISACESVLGLVNWSKQVIEYQMFTVESEIIRKINQLASRMIINKITPSVD